MTHQPIRQNVRPNCIINGEFAICQGEKNIHSIVNPGQGSLQNALMEIENCNQAAATAHLNWVTNYPLSNMTKCDHCFWQTLLFNTLFSLWTPAIHLVRVWLIQNPDQIFHWIWETKRCAFVMCAVGDGESQTRSFAAVSSFDKHRPDSSRSRTPTARQEREELHVL